MLQYVTGDLLAAPCAALTNAVNCKGVMGAGLALQFRTRWPRMFSEYRAACYQGRLRPGDVLPIEVGDDDPKWIVNVATKDDWRNVSQLPWIDRGLAKLRHWIDATQPASLAVPALGCGYGGLRWDDVQPLIEQHLADLPTTRILVYRPGAR